MKQAALPARSSPRTSSAQPSRSGQRCVGPAFPLNTECQQPATRSPTSLPSPSPTPPTPAHLPQCGSTPPSPTCLPPLAATAASRSTTCDPPPPSASWSCRRAPTPSLGTQWRPSTSRVRSPRAMPAKRAPPGGGRVGCPQLLFHMSTHALPMQQQPPTLTPPTSPPSIPHPPPGLLPRVQPPTRTAACTRTTCAAWPLPPACTRTLCPRSWTSTTPPPAASLLRAPTTGRVRGGGQGGALQQYEGLLAMQTPTRAAHAAMAPTAALPLLPPQCASSRSMAATRATCTTPSACSACLRCASAATAPTSSRVSQRGRCAGGACLPAGAPGASGCLALRIRPTLRARLMLGLTALAISNARPTAAPAARL